MNDDVESPAATGEIWGFSIPVEVAEWVRFVHYGHAFDVHEGVELVTRDDFAGEGPLTGEKLLELRGARYSTSGDAEAAAVRWMNHLSRAALHVGLPLVFAIGEKRQPKVFRMDLLSGEGTLRVLDESGYTYLDGQILRRQLSTMKVRNEINMRWDAAYDLWSRSSEMAPDARLITVVSALELFVVPVTRSEPAVALLREFQEQVDSSSLAPDERQSLVSQLSHLQKQSIRKAGRILVAELGPRSYNGLESEKFWDELYRLRSDLAHGNERPALHEIQLFANYGRILLRDVLIHLDELDEPA